MNGAEQITLARRLEAALNAVGLELAQPARNEGQRYYRRADYTAVVGWLYHGNYFLRAKAPDDPGEPAPPARHLALVPAGDE